MTHVVTDTHFGERARQPRLASFMASSLYNHGVSWQSMRAVAADERTAVAIDAAGVGSVFGSGKAHFVMAGAAPETLAPATALIWFAGTLALKVFEVPATATGANKFDLLTWSGTTGSTRYWSVNNGALTIK